MEPFTLCDQLAKWLSVYSGLSFTLPKIKKGGWYPGTVRPESGPLHYSIKESFWEALPKFGFSICECQTTTFIYQPKGPGPGCHIRRGDSLNVVITCRLARDEAGIVFTPNVRTRLFSGGDREAEERRRTPDPLFPLLLECGNYKGSENIEFLARMQTESLLVTWQEMGHDVRPLSYFFNEFVGKNSAFESVSGIFDPPPKMPLGEEMLFLETTQREPLFAHWKAQLELFKKGLVPAV